MDIEERQLGRSSVILAHEGLSQIKDGRWYMPTDEMV